MIDIKLLDHPVSALDVQSIPHDAGAECQFIGRTRLETHPEHGPLRRLSYDAYQSMATRVLRDLAEQATERFGCHAVRVHHAIGDVPPGEGSVLIQVVTGHRGESFDACRFLIDQLKKSAPIWKREEWADGTTWAEGTPAEAPPEDA